MWLGFLRRRDREWEQIAALGTWVLAPHSKRPITIYSLMGRPLTTLPPLPARERTPEEIEAEEAKLVAEAIAWATEP
jgi:hypothetical protein